MFLPNHLTPPTPTPFYRTNYITIYSWSIPVLCADTFPIQTERGEPDGARFPPHTCLPRARYHRHTHCPYPPRPSTYYLSSATVPPWLFTTRPSPTLRTPLPVHGRCDACAPADTGGRLRHYPSAACWFMADTVGQGFRGRWFSCDAGQTVATHTLRDTAPPFAVRILNGDQ